VTGYVILRSGNKTSNYSSIGTVEGRAGTAYTDTTVSGFNTTYWYEVEAVAGTLFSPAGTPTSATTPPLCL
jgi:hypothetical protein